jgi:nitronate monooxygenase
MQLWPAAPPHQRPSAANWNGNWAKQATAHPRACTKSFDCLAQCGLRDGLPGWGQFCIDNQLAAALRGEVRRGLFFRGAGALPFGSQIRSVRELLERLLTPAAAQPA